MILIKIPPTNTFYSNKHQNSVFLSETTHQNVQINMKILKYTV